MRAIKTAKLSSAVAAPCCTAVTAALGRATWAAFAPSASVLRSCAREADAVAAATVAEAGAAGAGTLVVDLKDDGGGAKSVEGCPPFWIMA